MSDRPRKCARRRPQPVQMRGHECADAPRNSALQHKKHGWSSGERIQTIWSTRASAWSSGQGEAPMSRVYIANAHAPLREKRAPSKKRSRNVAAGQAVPKPNLSVRRRQELLTHAHPVPGSDAPSRACGRGRARSFFQMCSIHPETPAQHSEPSTLSALSSLPLPALSHASR